MTAPIWRASGARPATTASTASRIVSAETAAGRKVARMSRSFVSFSTRSVRPAFENSTIASVRCLTSFRTTSSCWSSVSSVPASIFRYEKADRTERSVSSRNWSRAFIASLSSAVKESLSARIVLPALRTALASGGGLLLPADARLFVVLVLASLGEDSGLLSGLLEAAKRALDRLARCDANLQKSTPLSNRVLRRAGIRPR